MKKFFNTFIFFSILALFFQTSAYSLTNPVYSLVKDEIIRQMEKTLDREVTIGSVNGILVNDVTLKDIRIAKNKKISAGSVIYIKEARIHYDVIKAGLVRDFLPSIGRIELIEPWVYVEHDKKGDWNLIKLIQGDGGSAPPPLFHAKVSIINGKALFSDERGFGVKPIHNVFKQNIADINGIINLNKKGKAFFKANGKTKDESFYCEGRIDIDKSRAEIKISSYKVPLKKWNSYIEIPVLKNVDLDGFAKINLSSVITKDGIDLSGELQIPKCNIYGRGASGRISIISVNKVTKVKISQGILCGGSLSGDLIFDASQKDAPVKGKISFSGLDLAQLSGNIFETKGKSVGFIDISGTAFDTNISSKTDLSDSFLLGQKADKIAASLNIKGGNLSFKPIEIINNGLKLSASGLLDKDFNLTIDINGNGFKIIAPYVLGGINASVDTFEGTFSTTLSNDSIKDPLRKLEAKLLMAFSSLNAGGQSLESVSAQGNIGNGILDIEHFVILKNGSRISAAGKIGLYDKTSTDAKFTISDVSLSDYSSINKFLPYGIKDLAGLCNMSIELQGKSHHDFLKRPIESIFDLSASCEGSILNGSFAGQQFDYININARLKDKSIIANKLEIKSKNSFASLSGDVYKDGTIKMPFILNVDLADFRVFTQKYANIFGLINSGGELTGSFKKPILNISFSGKDILYNKLAIDGISGRAKYADNILSLFGPVVLKKDADEYSFSGNASIFGKQPSIEGRLFTEKGGVDSVSQIAQMIYLEISKRRRSASKVPGKILFNEDSFLLPKLSSFISKNKYSIYTLNNSFLKKWGIIESESQKSKDSLRPVKIAATGALKADIDFKFSGNNIYAKAILKTSHGSIGNYKFDGFIFAGNLKDKIFSLDNFYLKKGSGYLEAKGKANIDGAADFKITSKNLSLDSIETALNLPLPIKGRLNLSSAIGGQLLSPDISTEFYFNEAELRDIYLDSIHGMITFSGDTLGINNLDMFSGTQKASLKGIIPFNPQKKLSVRANLDGENAGILLSLFKGIKSSKGKGKAVIDVKGTIFKPKFNGYFFLKKGTVNMIQLKSSIENLELGISAKNNLVAIKQLSGFIKGESTFNQQIPVSIAGNVDISKAFDEKRIIGLDLSCNDFHGSINIPSFYSGDFSVSGVSIKGPLVLNAQIKEKLSPTLTGYLSLYDGHISLPKSRNGKTSLLPVTLNLTANLVRNIHLLQGDDQLLSAEMSKIEAYILSDNLKISGLISSPVILGDVSINSGSVSILGRDFELIPENTQEQFFSSDRSNVQKNAAVFTGTSGTIPNLLLSAKSEVTVDTVDTADTAKTDSSGKPAPPAPAKEKITVITKISGAPFVSEKPLNLKFFAFKEDKTKSPPEISLLQFDENQIRIVMLPDFLKSTLGFSKGGEPIDANAVIVDYINARLQSYLVRGITSNVEKILGLESFSLDYNFGRDLEKYLPTKRSETNNDPQQIGVGFVKGFFDRIYIQLRYAQAMSQTSLLGQTSLNYQITWKIDRHYSFVYYREPITFLDQQSTYYKMMLQSLYKF